MKSAILCCTMMAATVPAVARADDGRLGFSSSATATITVVIPPLQAGIAATEEGAVGLWTLTSNSDGLMVKIPDTMSGGESAGLDVFRASGNVFDVSLPTGAGFHLTSSQRSEHNGLMRQSYVLSNDSIQQGGPLQVLIRGI